MTAIPQPDAPPRVTRLKVVERGLACRCPNCGLPTLFKPGEIFTVNEKCQNCGLTFDKGAGAFLGPFVMNYTVTAFGFIVPIIILFVLGKISSSWTLALCAVAALGLPIAFYRRSWGWWLAVYYFFLPDNLPANLGGRPGDDE